MQFFLYEIVARIVAIYLCIDCGPQTVVCPCREKDRVLQMMIL